MKIPPTEDTFNILIASDIHLGYLEKDGNRGNDSFVAFEEILKIAQDKKVDLVLLGGDLFHDNKPSRQSRVKCTRLLRHYCMGDNPISVECVSDQSSNFGHYVGEPIINYEDPNLNVSIPVFSIHGNHDDPCGAGQLCALDELSTSGLINFFGKTSNLKEIVISPILLKKGTTSLALYGLGSLKDSRLYRLFKEQKVSMLRPKEDTDNWFNLFCIHQNRVARGTTDFIPDRFLNGFIDLVLWGHEHECRITPETGGSEGEFYITQPGSSVATSLCPGEAVPKHVGLLKIYKKEFQIEPIPLQTVRPFVYRELILSQCNLELDVLKPSEIVENYLTDIVEEMITDAQRLITGNVKQPLLPLLRLRVEYNDENQLFNLTYFSQSFIEKVANCDSLLLMKREKKKRSVSDLKNDPLFEDVEIAETRIDDLLKQYFDNTASLKLLSNAGISEAVQKFVEKDETDAIADIVNHQISKVNQYLETCHDLTEDQIAEYVDNFHANRLNNKMDYDQIDIKLPRAKVETVTLSDDEDFLSDDKLDSSVVGSQPKGKGRGRGRGRGSTKEARGKKTIKRYLK